MIANDSMVGNLVFVDMTIWDSTDFADHGLDMHVSMPCLRRPGNDRICPRRAARLSARQRWCATAPEPPGWIVDFACSFLEMTKGGKHTYAFKC
jgi:hypothetical protein